MNTDLYVKLEDTLSLVRSEKERYEREEISIWKTLYRLFDEDFGPDESARVVLSNGKILARVYQHRTQVNEDEAKKLLTQELWERVTRVVRVLDPDLFTKEVDEGTISQDIVEKVIEIKRIATKRYANATKEELAELAEIS